MWQCHATRLRIISRNNRPEVSLCSSSSLATCTPSSTSWPCYTASPGPSRGSTTLRCCWRRSRLWRHLCAYSFEWQTPTPASTSGFSSHNSDDRNKKAGLFFNFKLCNRETFQLFEIVSLKLSACFTTKYTTHNQGTNASFWSADIFLSKFYSRPVNTYSQYKPWLIKSDSSLLSCLRILCLANVSLVEENLK